MAFTGSAIIVRKGSDGSFKATAVVVHKPTVVTRPWSNPFASAFGPVAS